MEMKDSGKRQEFEGGAVRDTAEGKAKMSLLSPHLYTTAVGIGTAQDYGVGDELKVVLAASERVRNFMMEAPGTGIDWAHYLIIDLVRFYGVARLCNWLDLGAQKYSRFNWSKGMDFSRVVDSLLRHLKAIADGDLTEDHGAASCCNAMFLYHYCKEIQAGRLDPKWDDRFSFDMMKKDNTTKEVK